MLTPEIAIGAIAFLLFVGLHIWLARIAYRWGRDAGYRAAHRKAHPEQLIPQDKYKSRLSVLRP